MLSHSSVSNITWSVARAILESTDKRIPFYLYKDLLTPLDTIEKHGLTASNIFLRIQTDVIFHSTLLQSYFAANI